MSDSVKPWDLFKASQPKTIDGVRENRLEICNSCEYLIQLTNQCTKCGCFMSLKTKLRNAECPIGKW